MSERYISVTDDEYVYFLDTQSKNYKTLGDFEKKEFETAKKDNINVEECEEVILAFAKDKYWDYVYEHHMEVDTACDLLNEQEERIKELEEENASMKGRIIDAMVKSNQVECTCTTCVCEDYVNEELKKW